mgnify:CR=1 FL=1
MLPIIEQLAIGSVAMVGAVGLLLVREIREQGQRLARIEGRLGNGIGSEIRSAREALDQVQEELRTHVDGEEGRVLAALKRRGY